MARSSTTWGKGQCGNPDGLSKARREHMRKIRERLEEAFVNEKTGEDGLVAAIVAGVRQGEPSLIRLACEYRWGKPKELVEDEAKKGSSTFTLMIGGNGQATVKTEPEQEG